MKYYFKQVWEIYPNSRSTESELLLIICVESAVW